MKILIAANIPKNVPGGMQQHQIALAKYLETYGHKVVTIFSEDIWQPWISGFSKLTFPVLLTKNILLRTEKFNIVNIHEPMASFYCFYKKYIKKLPPCVITIHNAEEKVFKIKQDLAQHGLLKKPSLKTRITWPLFELSQARYSIKNADHIMCLSKEDFDFLTNHYKINGDKITIIKNGVETDFFLTKDRELKEIKVLIISTWLENKGKEIIKKVISYFSKFNIKWTIAGFHLKRESVLAEFPEHLHNFINLYPTFDRKELLNLLRKHHIFFLPSFYEGFPISLIESMAAGLCPIVSAVGGIKDILNDGVNGILFNPKDLKDVIHKFERVIQTPELIKKIGESAQKSAQNFTWEKVTKEIIDVFKMVAKKYGNKD